MKTSTDTPDWSALPAPLDDGLADHLKGMQIPSISLQSTDGQWVDLSSSAGGLIVVYAYPRTGVPGEPNPPGWDDIPGARGCTPQSCAFRDHFTDLKKLGVSAIYGLSTQDTDYQREVVERLHLPFTLLSDQGRHLTTGVRRWPDKSGVLPRLPTGSRRRQRFAMVIRPSKRNGDIVKSCGSMRSNVDGAYGRRIEQSLFADDSSGALMTQSSSTSTAKVMSAFFSDDGCSRGRRCHRCLNPAHIQDI